MVTAGKQSSEYTKCLRVEVYGGIVLLLGLLLVLFAAYLEKQVAMGGGLGLTVIGAYLAQRSSSTYARARATVKAAALTRPKVIARGL